VTKTFIPYGRQTIDDNDIEAVVSVLRSDYLTTGPKISEFENAVCKISAVDYGIAVSNGTAALHATMNAIGINHGDEVIVPPLTFAATANCVLYCGGKPVFVDVSPDTLLINPELVEAAITPKTKAIIGVDYAGQPCDWDSLRKISDKYSLILVADSCHAIGGKYKELPIGTLADMTVFSFHPVKHIACGEGGMVVTNNQTFAEKIRNFRGHGITSDAAQREKSGAWYYEMTDLGYNYRMTDIQCALGISQLEKLPNSIKKRNEIAHLYDKEFSGTPIVPLKNNNNVYHAYHLYVVKVPNRNEVFKHMRNSNIGVNVHYIPVYRHPYYEKYLGYRKGICPCSEEVYEQILSLPMWPGLKKNDIQRVISQLKAACAN
jgi:UDP-4-amino-4,6-dideoxy-N-acetyl-beta-L-altrosamine transaminase